MNVRRILILLTLLLLSNNLVRAQWPSLYKGYELNHSDPTKTYSHIAFSGELYDMVKGNIWEWNLKGGFAFAHNKHMVGLHIPFIRSVYEGIEDLYGIGDITIRYHWVPYESQYQTNSLKSMAFLLDLSIPTGDEFSGHGTGVPMLIPTYILGIRPVENVALYPLFRFIYSLGETNGEWTGGYPGVGTGEGGNVRVFQTDILFNIEFNQAWLGLAPVFSYEFNGQESTLSLRPELGILLGEYLSLKLTGAFYIAGRRRFNSWTMFDAGYYF
jgi:hypothetical protein